MSIKSIWNKIIGKEPQVYQSLNENPTEREKAQARHISALQGQIGEFLARQRKEQESEKDKDKSEEVKKELNEQARLIKKDSLGETISLLKFFHKIITGRTAPTDERAMLSQWAGKLEVSDYNDSEVFGKFGDIKIAKKDGDLIITDFYGNPLAKGKRIDAIIYKPETLGNQLKRGRILIPRDKDFNPVVDIENLEVPDIVYDEEVKQYRETEEFKGLVKDLWVKKDKEKREMNEYIERLELAQVNQKKEIDDLKREVRMYKNIGQVGSAELTQAQNLSLQTVSQIGEMQRKITDLTELKALYENQIEVFKGIVSRLLERVEGLGGSTEAERIKEGVFTDLERAKLLLPEILNIKEEARKEPAPLPNPGDIIGGRVTMPKRE